MRDRDIIYSHLHTHAQSVGFEMPETLEWYLADLLTARLSRVNIIPEPSFAERYLQLYSESRLDQFKDYADSALFFTALMPEYGRRRGLDVTYYASLGISVYYTLGDLAEDPRYTQLANWFYHLQRFLATALAPERRLEMGYF